MWTLPSIFSASRTMSGRFALGLVPMPSSAMLRLLIIRSLLSSGIFVPMNKSWRYRSPSLPPPSILTTRPSLTVIIIFSSSLGCHPFRTTIFPSAVPSMGAPYASPAGRFPQSPGSGYNPVSGSNSLPNSISIKVPSGPSTLAFRALVAISASSMLSLAIAS